MVAAVEIPEYLYAVETHPNMFVSYTNSRGSHAHNTNPVGQHMLSGMIEAEREKE